MRLGVTLPPGFESRSLRGRSDPMLADNRTGARSSTDRASDYGSEGWEFESLRARTSYSTADQRRRYEARSDMMALMDLCPSDCPTPVTQVVKVLAHQAGEVQRCIRRSTGTSPVRDRFGSSNCVDVYSALCNNRISQMPVWTIGAGSAYGTRLALRACRRGFLLRDWVRAGRTFRTGSALPWSGGNTRNWCDNDGASGRTQPGGSGAFD
jgi:hypothetical protein